MQKTETILNVSPILENVRRERMGASFCQLDLEGSLPQNQAVNDNSWFAFGRFEVEPGHFVNFLFHIMSMKMPLLGEVVQSLVTVFDETTGSYCAKDYLHPGRKVKIGETEFRLEVPCGRMSGDWNAMRIQFEESGFRLDITAAAIHYPILIGANSVIDMCGMCIHEYSVPRMRVTGTLTLNGMSYDVADRGFVWFDRQWQNINYFQSRMKWTWFSISLDNGEIYSIFDTDLPGWEDNVLAVLCPDGTQKNFRHFKPLVQQETEYWHSPASKQTYPVRWKLELAELGLNLSVVPIKKEQEIVSVLGELNKYEGCCTVEGTRNGVPVRGTALVELIGHWKP